VTPTDHVVLIGMMGVGKSTVGRVLADRWGRPFVDADDELERRAGSSVEALFAKHGEAGFRQLEADVLVDLLAAESPQVISCGGGVVTEARNRALLGERSTVVWLTAPVDVLALRVGDGVDRPLLGDDPAAALQELVDRRMPLYESVADHVVDTADRSPATVVQRVVQVIG
jgi:shikimate kinase